MNTEHKGRSEGTGCLYVVATPIGNLADLSQRAVDTLRGCDLIAAEDTRHSKRLLSHADLTTPLRAIHEHSSRADHEQLVQKLANGGKIALISDAGTPLISDPGYELVRRARGVGIKVVPIPGPCAAIAALSVAGLPTDQFEFRGFPPAKANARAAFYQSLGNRPHTQVFYESSHRVVVSVNALAIAFGPDRAGFLARELTKLHEQTVAAPIGEIASRLNDGAITVKGEFVVIVEGRSAPDRAQQTDQAARLLTVLLAELPMSRAAAVTARLTGLGRRECYAIAEQLGNSEPQGQ